MSVSVQPDYISTLNHIISVCYIAIANNMFCTVQYKKKKRKKNIKKRIYIYLQRLTNWSKACENNDENYSREFKYIYIQLKN